MLAHSITTEDWLEYAKEKSREEGIEIGKAEGISLGVKREQDKVAKNMLKLNISKDIIAEVTGLTLEEIDGL